MKNSIKFLFILFIMSCVYTKISAIEVIKFDAKIIDDLRQKSDSSYAVYLGRSDFFTANYYIDRKDSIITKVLKDSVGNVRGFNQTKNGIVLFAAEYFPNGQLRSNWPQNIYRYNGKVRYYYPDGRVESEAQYKNGQLIVKWKHYDKDGHFISKRKYHRPI